MGLNRRVAETALFLRQVTMRKRNSYSLELSRRINRIQFDIVYGDEFFYRQQKPRFDRRVTRARGETYHIDCMIPLFDL
jgi:hypothetical protein